MSDNADLEQELKKLPFLKDFSVEGKNALALVGVYLLAKKIKNLVKSVFWLIVAIITGLFILVRLAPDSVVAQRLHSILSSSYNRMDLAMNLQNLEKYSSALSDSNTEQEREKIYREWHGQMHGLVNYYDKGGFSKAYAKRNSEGLEATQRLIEYLEQAQDAYEFLPEGDMEYKHDMAILYSWQSHFLTCLGSLDKAEESVNHSLAISSQIGGNYIVRSRIYVRQSKLPEALGDANEAIRLYPNNWYYYRERAQIYRQMNNNEAAEQDEALAVKLRANFDEK